MPKRNDDDFIWGMRQVYGDDIFIDMVNQCSDHEVLMGGLDDLCATSPQWLVDWLREYNQKTRKHFADNMDYYGELFKKHGEEYRKAEKTGKADDEAA